VSLLHERLGLLDLGGIQGFRINIKPGAWLQSVDNDQADKKRERRDGLEVD
jgi:hypothetical protein